MRHWRGFFLLQVAACLLCSGCQTDDGASTDKPTLVVPPSDPGLASVARQITQVHAERQSIQQHLDPSMTDKGSFLPSEDDIRQASYLIQQEYKRIGQMPTRSQIMTLLTTHMPLGTTPEQQQKKAIAILDVLMLD